MTTRAKLVCISVTPQIQSPVGLPETKDGELVEFETRYNTEDSKEDNTFSLATPHAAYRMFVSEPKLYGRYEVGKAYTFDINPADGGEFAGQGASVLDE